MVGERERYSIIKRLDKGGMAEVFLARSTSLEGFDKVVAIKRVLPHLAANERFVNMFLDEAKLSLHLDHANIVSVFDVGRSGQTYFIVMEFIDGTNMKRLIEGRAMPLDLAVYVAIEVCKGLVYAHEKIDSKGQPLQIVHRDISPPNILISREGEVKLTDFGLARAVSQIESTDPGVVKGKFAYLSPEASHGEEVDLRADIFAAGIVLWESLTGRRLFQGNTDLETLENVRACNVPSIHRIRTDIPPALDRILNRALAKNPADRYSSARDLGRELSKFLVEQRMSVTSYDLAAWIQELIDLPPDVSLLSPSLAESAVQAELERFVGLEEDSVVVPTSARGAQSVPKSSFEDPRLWGLMDDASSQALDNVLENTPSGVLDIRSGTQKLGRPLTDAETLGRPADAVPRPSLPPIGAASNRPRSTTTTKTLPRGAVIPTKGSGARRLPPPIAAPGPPASLPKLNVDARPQPPRRAPAKPSLPPVPSSSRTMMMTPLEEAFFDSLDGAKDLLATPTTDASSADAVSVVSPQHTPAQRPLPEGSTLATARPPLSTTDATRVEAQETPSEQQTPQAAALPVEAVPSPIAALETESPIETSVAGQPESTAGRTEQLAVGKAARVAQAEAQAEASAKQAKARKVKAEDVGVFGVEKPSRPWMAQLVSLGAFAGIVYFSYQILSTML